MARDAANDARLAAAARAKAAAEALTPAAIAAKTAEQVAAGIKSTDPKARIGDETAAEANARITAGYRNQERPELTQEGEAAGATLEFVRTAAGGVGTYKEIYPIGTPIPTERTTAYGNVYDAQGNLIRGSGLKTPVVSDATASDTVVKNAPPITKLEDLSAAQRRVIEANAGNELIPVKRDANGVITEYRQMSAQEYLTSKGGLTRAGYFGNDIGMSDEEYFGLLKKGGVELLNATMEARNRASETKKLLDHYKGMGMNDADAQKAVDDAFAEMSASGASTTKTTDPNRPIGTPPAFVFDPISRTYKMPPKPTKTGTWAWDNNKGWVDTTVNPGSTGFETGSEKTLSVDTFKNTLALFFGAKEMSQPWANALFKVVSSYYKTGSTIDESLNLALQDARNKPELKPFTDRFAGVFALQDRRAKGEAVDVPTIAEFFKSQEELGTRLRDVGLGDLATNEILGEVLGTGKSVAAVLNLVNDVFMTIDNAPEQLKKDLQVVAPGIDRTSIAKALLLGKRGAEDLQKQIKEVSVLSAAKSQGIGIDNALAADLAARGIDYGTALTNFGTVAKGAPDLQKLTEISTGQAVKPVSAQETIIKSLFQQDVKEQEKIRLEAEKEAARFGGASGTMGSRSLASRNRANRVI